MSEGDTKADLLCDGFRIAMRGMAQSVVVISLVDAWGRRFAMAATAVTSVSMAPPTLLCCINARASAHSAMAEGARFAINILTSDHRDLAGLCSGGASGEARFAQHDWAASDDGVPYLLDAQAIILCKQERRIAVGSHSIIIGQVETVHATNRIDPLVYIDGRYSRLPPFSD